MHAYNVNQGTYDFFREFQVSTPASPSTTSISDGYHSKFQYPKQKDRSKSKSLIDRSSNRPPSTTQFNQSSQFNRPRTDSELDEFDTQAVRFKPESLDNLVKLTKFNRRELKLMYRGFKQVSFVFVHISVELNLSLKTS